MSHPVESREQERMEIGRRLARRMAGVRRKVVVLSGKGGVGKSTVAVNLAVALARRREGGRVGILDVDLHGPSVPRMLGLEGRTVSAIPEGLLPVPYDGRLAVMSIGFLVRDETAAVIWRGPRKYGAIRQFLADVEWGELDWLVIDSPPGTGDEPLAVCQLLAGEGEPDAADGPDDRGAVVVTTPQAVAVDDVRRCVRFCREVGLPIHGVVENMSGLLCPHCGREIDLFRRGGGEAMAREMGVRFLGRVPLDPSVVECGDSGRPVVTRPDVPDAVGRAFDALADALVDPGGGGEGR
jgi:Mrp family chromosome partitioning ATPase